MMTRSAYAVDAARFSLISVDCQPSAIWFIRATARSMYRFDGVFAANGRSAVRRLSVYLNDDVFACPVPLILGASTELVECFVVGQ